MKSTNDSTKRRAENAIIQGWGDPHDMNWIKEGKPEVNPKGKRQTAKIINFASMITPEDNEKLKERLYGEGVPCEYTEEISPKFLNIKLVEQDIISRNEELAGKDICLIYCIEEASEVIKELTKMLRDKGDRGNLVEEISDLYYTLSMLVEKYGITEEEINTNITKKEIYAEDMLHI